MKRKIDELPLPAVLLAICLTLSGCIYSNSKNSALTSTDPKSSGTLSYTSKDYAKPKVIARLQDESIRESSGIVASRRNKGIFWTHNDSGDDPFLYAFDREGKKRGVWKVAGAKNVDWEDIAAFTDKNGESFLFIGDIGNNERDRRELVIYRVREPEISATDAESNKKNPILTENAEAIRVSYPDAQHNAETLLVHPQTGDLYVLSKTSESDAGIYKLPAPYTGKTQTLEHLGSIAVPSITRGLLTAGEISPDGKRVILCDYFAAYEFVLPEGAKSFDVIWKETASSIDADKREQGEAVCYGSDGRSIFATSEKKNPPLIEIRRK
jgi:hypothetical protein